VVLNPTRVKAHFLFLPCPIPDVKSYSTISIHENEMQLFNIHEREGVAGIPSFSCWMIIIGSSFVLDLLNWPDPQTLLGFDEPLPILTFHYYSHRFDNVFEFNYMV